MTAGDVNVILYAYSGTFDMTGGAATLLVQLQQAGQPPAVNPPTVGLPPHGPPTPLPPHKTLVLNVGGTPHTDSNGNVHAPGTWANYATTGTEFPVGGTYNVQLRCVGATNTPGSFTSPVQPFYVDPLITP